MRKISMNKHFQKYFVVLLFILATGFGIFMISKMGNSTTGSASIQKIQNDLYPEQAVSHGHGLAVDVENPGKLYIATHHGLLVLLDDKDLYRVGKSKDDYMGFQPDPVKANTFFSSGHPSSGGNLGFQKSEDGGLRWKKISNGRDGPVDFHTMAVSSVNPDVMYGWYQGDIQVSTDGGENWAKYPESFPIPIIHLAADSKDESTLYASTPAGLQKSSDKGKTWKALFDGLVVITAVHPMNSQILLSFSQRFGLAKSDDGGVTWKSTNQNFDGEEPLFISFSRKLPEIAYLLTDKNSIYKSSDSGINWNKVR